MNALRIRKRLDEPIPQLPELTPLVGRTVEIIVIEESDLVHAAPAPDAGAPAHFDDLLGGWPEEERDDAFERAIRDLRWGRRDSLSPAE